MTERDISKQIAAAEALKASLATMTDDAEAIRDTIQGETSLHECIAAVMEEITEAEISIAGLETMIGKLSERQSRVEKRLGRLRAAVEQAMVIGEITSFPTPGATLSLKSVPAKLIIEDEAKIPAEFWKPQDPMLNKKEIAVAIKSGREVPGAMFGNGGVTLAIRRS